MSSSGLSHGANLAPGLKVFIALAAVAFLGGGCNTLGDAKASRGRGLTRTYPASFDRVWSEVPPAANDLDLSIAGSYKSERYILAERGTTMFSWGEKVAVFLDPVGPQSTLVEVVSKRAVSVNITAADFEKRLLDKIGERLGLTE